ncbi:DUF3040 domain-containing protein [Streptacidiphilus sp. MAP12-33]|uniref:DUF3040 domain-containing protein n=1 Tax=Streptacidiphilus sp. MAP12-33 TaxID=3156266 RepID=UPI003512A3A1
MLSEREQRDLAIIEQALRAEAPELDRRLRNLRARAGTRHLIVAAVVAVGLVLFAAAFALHSADALLLSVLILLGAASWVTVGAFAMYARRRARR